MSVYGIWYGGASYSLPDMRALERFDSTEHATETFRDRAETSGAAYLETYYVNHENEPVRFPGVDETTTMDVYDYDPRKGYSQIHGPSFTLSLDHDGNVCRD